MKLILLCKIRLHHIAVGFRSVQFSCSVVSDSLQPHESQHARPPCPSPTPEFTQTHVCCVGDAIQPSHPLSSTSPPTFNLSQHQGLFKWVSSSHEVAKVLEFQLQHQSYQWTPRTDCQWTSRVSGQEYLIKQFSSWRPKVFSSVKVWYFVNTAWVFFEFPL